jgi:microcystin-dependent protein
VLAHNIGDPASRILYDDGNLPYDFRNGNNRVWLWEGWFSVAHNPDGTHPGFQFMGGRAMANPPGGVGTATQYVYPPTIPRASTPSIAGGSSKEVGSPLRIETNRASNSFTHNLSFAFGNWSQSIATGVGASFDWTPPLALLQQIPNETSGGGTLWCETFNGSTSLGVRSIPVMLSAPASVVPTVNSITLADDNPNVVALVGAFVQGLSIVKATVNAQGVQGSTIRSSAFGLDGKTAPSGGSIPTDVSGSRPITATATDSRGRVGTFAVTINVLPYAPPSAPALQVRRAVAGGTVNEDGTLLRVELTASAASIIAGGAQKNSLTIRAFTRLSGTSAWTARDVINPSGLSYASNFLITGGGIFDATSSYDVRIEVADKFATVSQVVQVSTSAIAVDINGNSGVGIGQYHQRGALDVRGDTYTSGEVYHHGGIPAGIPVGYGGIWFSGPIPAGHLACRGQQDISRTTYAALFALWGTKYGSGDGSTTFGLPDLRMRVPVGLMVGDSDFGSLGQTGGQKSVALSAAEMPSTVPTVIGGATQWYWNATGPSRANGGGGQPHTNLQPYLVVDYIVKAL